MYTRIKRKPFIVFIFCLLVLLPLFTGCKGKGDLKTTVRINIVTWPGFGPIFLGKEKGFFLENGVEVDCQIQENTEARRASLHAGRIDLIGITVETAVLERAKGVPVTFVGVTDISAGGDGVLVRNDVSNIKELAGKTVAFPEGQPSHIFLLYLLEKAGVSYDSVKPKYTDDAGRAGELFAAGKVDAAVTWEPWLSTVEAKGKGKVIARSDGKTPILIGGFMADSTKLTDERVDALSKFLRGWYRALEYYQANQEESIAIMAKGFGMPDAEFKDILQGLRFIGKAEAMEMFGSGDKIGTLRDAVIHEAELWFKAGVIDNKEKTEKAFDCRPMNRAFPDR